MHLLIGIVLILLDLVPLERSYHQHCCLFISLLCLGIMSSEPLKAQITLSIRAPKCLARELWL